MGGLQVDRTKNESTGVRGTSKDSFYFLAESDSSASVHQVTLNYSDGHFCSCKGQIAKLRKFGPSLSRLNTTQSLTLPQPSRHWCKHVHAVRSAPADFRLESRRQRNAYFGIHEPAVDVETGTTEEPQSGRQAALNHTARKQAERGDSDARERLAALDAERDALLVEVEAERQATELRDGLDALFAAHGKDAVIAAMVS